MSLYNKLQNLIKKILSRDISDNWDKRDIRDNSGIRDIRDNQDISDNRNNWDKSVPMWRSSRSI